ncbi:hypothetical protein TELCIR_16375, partial [Teladorsagia circumcincta]
MKEDSILMGEPKDYVDVGEGKGKGYSVNIPWNHAYIGDDAYRAAFAKIVMPIAYEFGPEIVFISAGFDAATGDPLGEYRVSADTFALMTYQLMGLAGGRVIAVLEGDSSVITQGWIVTGEIQSRLPRRVWDSFRGVATSQEPYWNCLKGFQTAEVPEEGIDANSVCDVCNEAAEPWVCLTCYKASAHVV